MFLNLQLQKSVVLMHSRFCLCIDNYEKVFFRIILLLDHYFKPAITKDGYNVFYPIFMTLTDIFFQKVTISCKSAMIYYNRVPSKPLLDCFKKESWTTSLKLDD